MRCNWILLFQLSRTTDVSTSTPIKWAGLVKNVVALKKTHSEAFLDNEHNADFLDIFGIVYFLWYCAASVGELHVNYMNPIPFSFPMWPVPYQYCSDSAGQLLLHALTELDFGIKWNYINILQSISIFIFSLIAVKRQYIVKSALSTCIN